MYDHVQSIKEVLRHILHVSGLEHILRTYKKLRGYKTGHLGSASLEDRFHLVYENGVWLHETGQESLSGLGSEAEVVKAIAPQLSDHLSSLKAESIVDVGCGDFQSFKDCQFDGYYIGIDVVADVISNNLLQYKDKSREFRKLNAAVGPLPEADVVLVREVLFHLSFEDAKRVLRNIASSGARYLIATNDFSIWFNSDISSGDFRKLNLLKSPFRLPSPFHEIDDSLVAKGRVLATWKIQDLPVF